MGARDRGIASRQKSPAHGWLEARDNSLGGPPKQTHRENLPPPQSLLGDIGRLPVHLPSHHISTSGSAGQSVSSVSPYAAADDAFNLPQSPYAPANRTGGGSVGGGNGTGGNGALDFGTPSVYSAREQAQYRPGSTAYSQSLPPLPSTLGESFFSSINAERRSSRHGDDTQVLPSMSTGTNGSYNSLPHSLRNPSLVRGDSTSSQQSFRYDQQPLAPANGHWS